MRTAKETRQEDLARDEVGSLISAASSRHSSSVGFAGFFLQTEGLFLLTGEGRFFLMAGTWFRPGGTWFRVERGSACQDGKVEPVAVALVAG